MYLYQFFSFFRSPHTHTRTRTPGLSMCAQKNFYFPLIECDRFVAQLFCIFIMLRSVETTHTARRRVMFNFIC
jgi:hypothetical protein